MHEHRLAAFDKQLEELDAGVAEMGRLARAQVAAALDALASGSQTAAREIIAGDSRLDALEREVEEKAVLTIARNQPMAIDLRQIVAALKVSSNIERIGDLAKNIAKRTIAMEGRPLAPELTRGFSRLGDTVLAQLDDVFSAYAAHDDKLAMQVWRRDVEVDAQHTSVFRELLTYMLEDTRKISACTHLLFCAKNIERMGDHATNIAETLHYMVTGEPVTDDRPKSDRSSNEALSEEGK